jgi:hypothetical protein
MPFKRTCDQSHERTKCKNVFLRLWRVLLKLADLHATTVTLHEEAYVCLWPRLQRNLLNIYGSEKCLDKTCKSVTTHKLCVQDNFSCTRTCFEVITQKWVNAPLFTSMFVKFPCLITKPWRRMEEWKFNSTHFNLAVTWSWMISFSPLPRLFNPLVPLYRRMVGPKVSVDVVEVGKPSSAGNRTSSPSVYRLSYSWFLLPPPQQQVELRLRTCSFGHHKGPNPGHLIGPVEPVGPLWHVDVQSLDFDTETGYPDLFCCGFPKFP